MKKTFPSTFLILIVCLILNFSCDKASVNPESAPVYERGHLLDTEELATYTPEQITQILNFLNIDHNLIFKYTVKVIKIEYQTTDSKGTLLRASGAIMVPVTSGIIPVLSINHGTVIKRTQVASEGAMNSVEGVGGLMTASLGYLTCVPDYLGYGVSKELHPYVHAKSLAISIIDMIRATIHYGKTEDLNLSGHLFLTGYSEGGYATLATQKEIEEDYSYEFELIAVAPMAGPYDLARVVHAVLSQDNYPSPVYIAFMMTAYNEIYGWDRLEDIFNSPYVSMMPGFFDGTRSYSDVNNQLPKKVSTLLKPEFISNYLNGREPEIKNAMEENTLLDWSPNTRIRFFHGDADEDVPYSNVLNTINRLTNQTEVDIDLVTIKGGTHESSGLPCIFGMIDWFEQIRNSQDQTIKLLARDVNKEVHPQILHSEEVISG